MRISPCVPVCSSIFRLSQNSIVIARVTKITGTHWNTPPARQLSGVDLIPLLVLTLRQPRAPPYRICDSH